jgi:U6 snRNA-associated Sm-like protein LSm4
MIFFEMQLVELKNGETYNGHLVNCDTWMNIHLREVICTSKDGDHFWRMPECYIRGNTIKYLRVPDEVSSRHEQLCLALLSSCVLTSVSSGFACQSDPHRWAVCIHFKRCTLAPL